MFDDFWGILFMVFCSFHRCCLIRGLRYYLNHGWDSNRQLLVNRPGNIHSVLSPLCHLHLTWQLPALQRILFWPQTSGLTQRESPVLFFFFFFFLNQHNCLRRPHLMYCHKEGETFKSQCCTKSFNYLFIFALWEIPKKGSLRCEPFRLCLLLPCRVTCVHCSAHMSQPGFDSTGLISAAFAIHYFMRNLS